MITVRPATTDADLQAILDLQALNLPQVISAEERREQGFVTIQHQLEGLRAMNQPHGHAMAWDGDQLAGYALVTDPSLRQYVPIILPFFERLEQLRYRGRSLKEVPYVAMGQVAVAKAYRGQGVFAQLYADLERRLAASYELLITEIALRNTRSLRAHEKVGYPEWERYTDPRGEVWVIVKKELTSKI